MRYLFIYMLLMLMVNSKLLGQSFFQKNPLIGYEITGHNRFENSKIDIGNTIIHEERKSLVRLKKVGQKFIDPTGIYRLGTVPQDFTKRNTGRFGKIEVKLINRDEIFLYLHINRGGPSYNSGVATDTLKYRNNNVTYYYPDKEDPSCAIIFQFSEKGVQVNQKGLKDIPTCGFGYAVYADGFYKKTSSKMPEFMYPNGTKIFD